jgi:hypothetical protein
MMYPTIEILYILGYAKMTKSDKFYNFEMHTIQ